MTARAATSLPILFIGNSFTARNDLPGMIERLAAARGKSVRHRLINVGGASLKQHWNAGKALAAIREGQYHYVVLQEQSTLPVKNAKRMRENVRLFDEPVRASGAKMLLYLTWARRHAPESQAVINAAYTEIGKELGATVVPVGVAWEQFLAKHEQPILHDRDQSHPSPAGSYLAACVFFATLFDESPEGIDSEMAGLSEPDRGLLQQAAWRACGSLAAKRS